MKGLPKRSHPRLKSYDYTHGWYFVTVCTDKHRECLGHISVGRGDHTPPHVKLSPMGQVVEKYIQGINTAHPNVSVDTYVVMPNHVHMVIAMEAAGGGGV